MAKVTSKLQLTIPTAIAKRYGIRPGDRLDWNAAGEAIRVTRAGERTRPNDVASRLRLFDQATERQRRRQARRRKENPPRGRGWTREALYERRRSR